MGYHLIQTSELIRFMIGTCATSVIKDNEQSLEDWRILIFGPQSILLTEAFKQALTSNRETGAEREKEECH